jgi:hypothetical protein
MITKEQINKAEQQVYELRKSVRYDIRELTIEIIVNKYTKGLDYQEDDDSQDKDKFRNVLFIPEYQRDFTWDKKRQSRFIESVLLGLPIPLVFVAENKDSAWEIVDGSQRIRTLHAFINNDLCLDGLERIDTLNGFLFKNLDVSRQGKFLDISLRMIVLSEEADDEVKRDMFERINRGSDLLKPMEKRKGIYRGKFTDFIYDLCANPAEVKTQYKNVNVLLYELTPVDKWLKKRQEREELVLRYFALTENNKYAHFPKDSGIASFLDDFLDKKNKELEQLNESQCHDVLQKSYEEFEAMLSFVKKYSEYGFRKTHNPQTKRVIFETLSIGVSVALRKNTNLTCTKEKMTAILNSMELKSYFYGNGQQMKAYDPRRIKERIEFVVNKLLEK